MTDEEWKSTYAVGNIYKSPMSGIYFTGDGKSSVNGFGINNAIKVHSTTLELLDSRFNPWWKWEGKYAELIKAVDNSLTNYSIC